MSVRPSPFSPASTLFVQRRVPAHRSIFWSVTFFVTFLMAFGMLEQALTYEISLRESFVTMWNGKVWQVAWALWMILYGFTAMVLRVFMLTDVRKRPYFIYHYVMYMTMFILGFAGIYKSLYQPDHTLLSLRVVAGLDVLQPNTPRHVVFVFAVQRLLWELCWAVTTAGIFFSLHKKYGPKLRTEFMAELHDAKSTP